MNDTYCQRMRVLWVTDDSVKYVGHLDMARAWERGIRRAGLPLAYSQGFNPQPRLQFAAALPVGFTSEAELVDVYLNTEWEPAALVAALTASLPPGIRPIQAYPVARALPSLQSQLRAARYRVEVESGDDEALFQARVADFLALPAAWRLRRRGKDQVRYDLRPLVLEITSVERHAPGDTVPAGQEGAWLHSFRVTMHSDPGATGRPDELLAELGLETAVRRIVREALVFAEEG